MFQKHSPFDVGAAFPEAGGPRTGFEIEEAALALLEGQK